MGSSGAWSFRRNRVACAAEGRDASTIAVTHLAPARILASDEPEAVSPEARGALGAASVEEHIGRCRELAEAGVQTEIIALSDAAGPSSVAPFADLIAAFRT